MFWEGTDDKKPKGEDRSLDLEGKPLPPPQVLSGTPANRAKKRDSLDEHPSAKTERSSSPTTTVKYKKQDSKLSRVQMKASRSAQDVHVRKSENCDLKDEELADRRSKNKGTSMEELEWCFHQR